MSIEKYVSPFIANQFPSFYKEEGPNFIAFVKAYYEWMESTGKPVGEARSLLEYLDIDTTSDLFVTYFKNTLINSLPESIVTDKVLLMKHILDLYRSKGTKRAYELLFRILYGEDIELYIPSNYIFKPSDNTWKIPTYIETTSHPKLSTIIGTKIRNNAGATGIVESVDKKIVNGRTINILSLTNVFGEFKRGDRVYQALGTNVTASDGPIIVGSLNTIAITNGGRDYKKGDILDVTGSGVEAKARVATVINQFNNSIDFLLLDGGTGYTTNAVVTVKTTLNLSVTNTVGAFTKGQTVLDTTTNANGTIVFANTSLITVIDNSTTLSFVVGNQVNTATGSATIERISGGIGSGATFKVGGITNKETLELNTDTISDYYSVQLDQTTNSHLLQLSSVSGTFNVGDTVTSTANSLFLEGTIISANAAANGESYSNSSLNINDLYIYRSDGGHSYVTSATDSNLNNANIVAGVILVSNISSSIIELVTTPTKQTITGNAVIETVSGSNLSLSSVNGYFIPTKTITSNSGATATLDSITRLTDWNFLASGIELTNLDSTLESALTYNIFEVGTIEFITGVNPGSQYVTKPYIDVIEPEVAALNITDEQGNIKGHDAVFDSSIIGGNGIITSVEMLNSGYGYLDGETVTLKSSNNTTTVEGYSIVNLAGHAEGRWLNKKSFVSDEMKLQDSLFYQDFSYQIVAEKMLSMYENIVRNFVHPSGMALYGRYRLNDELLGDTSNLVESSIS